MQTKKHSVIAYLLKTKNEQGFFHETENIRVLDIEGDDEVQIAFAYKKGARVPFQYVAVYKGIATKIGDRTMTVKDVMGRLLEQWKTFDGVKKAIIARYQELKLI